MTMDRRRFTALLSAALAGTALPLPLDAAQSFTAEPLRNRGRTAVTPQETYFRWERISDRVRAAIGGGGNTVLVRGRTGALQSDGKNFGLGTTIRREAEAHGVPVTVFLNTHHHGDHSGGNAAFMDVRTIAHRHTEPRIRATAERNLGRIDQVFGRMTEMIEAGEAPGEMADDLARGRERLAGMSPQDFVPAELHDGRVTVDLGDGVVELHWISEGHTDGDTFLHLPEEKVIHAGDLLFHGRHPYVDVGGGATPAGWMRCLDAMLALTDGDTVVVPGHGAIGGPEVIRGQQAYFHQLMEIVEGGLRDGRSRDEIVAERPANLVELNGAERFLPTNLGIVYDEMAG